jgi:hypothetical protein
MGTNSSSYDKGDAAKETGSSVKEASGAWHQARDDAVSSGHLTRGEKDGGGSGSFSRSDSSGQAATSFWESIFGSK